MRRFERLTAVAAPLPDADVDTDQIIPARFLERRPQDGLADCLFHDRRRDEPAFVLNRPAWREAGILVAGPNFGCGSSREHAILALLDYGIRAVVSPGTGEIFANNAFENGLLLVTLDRATVENILRQLAEYAGAAMTVDLAALTITDPHGTTLPFAADPRRRRCLLEGLDTIALTLRDTARIDAFEAGHRAWP